MAKKIPLWAWLTKHEDHNTKTVYLAYNVSLFCIDCISSYSVDSCYPGKGTSEWENIKTSFQK